MKIVVCEPGKLARIEEICGTIPEVKNKVGGNFAKIQLSLFGLVIVCNAGADWLFWNPCRVLRSRLVCADVPEVIFGRFFICRQNEKGELIGLTESQAKEYAEFFRLPERFMFSGGKTNVEDDTAPQCISFEGVEITANAFDPEEEKKDTILNNALDKCARDGEGNYSLLEYIAQEIIDRRFKAPVEEFRPQIVKALEYIRDFCF